MVLLTNIRHALQHRHSDYHHRPTTISSSSIRIFISSFQLVDDQQISQKRHLSSRKRTTNNSFQLDALPFRVSPQEAYTQFQQWADREQGLGPFLNIGGPIGSATISAAYTPFWYFDLNIRFVPPNGGGSRRDRANYNYSNFVPEPFRTAYPSSPNGTIHIPGLASYAGFSYRRSLIDPVHNTTPVFMQKDITPFGSWMMEPLKANAAITGGGGEEAIEIFPDPWNATRERSLNVIYEELVDMANDQYSKSNDGDESNKIQVEIERLRARRIYMPTYIVDYKILGVTYRAFLSGCDASVSVSGISHKTIFSDSASPGGQPSEVFRGASSFLSQKAMPLAGTAVQFFGLRPVVAIAQLGFNLIARLAMKLHIVGLFGGLFVTYQKIVRPYFADKESREKWERQRDHEAEMQSFSYHSFRDYDGSAQKYFARNRERILRSLGGEEGREKEEGNSWYQQWEEWAREQFEQAQREASRAQQEWQRQQQQQQQGGQYQQGQYKQQQQQYKQQQQQTGRQYKQKTKEEEYKWDFDVNDPYSVLGVSRGASKEEVSKAFRREMLKHHPDVQSNSSEEEKRKATERSKLISDAYRKIKATQKR
mmetsp:Transcript_25807/g.51752  ORF Transcript_25807/g.51752 Transcript_25807/m.51752 type:complete len:595 (-) Transcript_25807:1539-3323(-)